MAQTTAQTAAMAQAVVHVDNAGGQITTIRQQVSEAVGATASGYVSEAATLFRNVMAQWDQDFATIIQGLHTIAENLTGTTRNYAGAMDSDRQSANKIASMLSGAGTDHGRHAPVHHPPSLGARRDQPVVHEHPVREPAAGAGRPDGRLSGRPEHRGQP